MSKPSLSELSDPKRVAEAAEDPKSREHAMLCGALGAIEKGGVTVPMDDSIMQKAAHYGRVLSGIEKQKLSDKHFGEIAKLVGTFLKGSQKPRKASRMKPSDLSQELRRIAAGIEKSKSPSKELVLKDIRKLVAAVGGQVNVLNKPVDIGPTELGPSCTITLHRCDFLGEKSASNVEGTIDCGGMKTRVSVVSAGRGGSRQTFDPPESAQMFSPDEFNSLRPIDAFTMAVEAVATREGHEVHDILTVENGLITHGL
jgi:hypothetical protein